MLVPALWVGGVETHILFFIGDIKFYFVGLNIIISFL